VQASDDQTTQSALSLERIAVIAVIVAIFGVTIVPRLDPDLWWHLRTGQLILELREIPRVDPFSFTFAGKPWLNHEWLGEVALYVVHRAVGVAGLMFLLAAVMAATYSLVWRRMRIRGVDVRAGLPIVGAAFLAGSISLGPRLQMATLLLSALFALGIDRMRRDDDKRWAFALPLLMLVWTNLHGGFAIGLALLAIAVAGQWLDTREVARIKTLAACFGASLAAALVNPNGIAQLAYPLRFLTPNPFTALIQESASPDFHVKAMLVFEILLLAGLAAVMRSGLRVAWTDVLVVIAFTHLAFSQARNVAVWAVVVSPIVAGAVSVAAAPALARMCRVALLLAAGVAMGLIGLASVKGQVEEEAFPSRAVQTLRRAPLGPNLFTTYHWGGYAIWTLHPRYRVFIDGRADTLYDASILREYYDVHNGSPQWREIFARRGVMTALVERRSFIAMELLQARDWRLVYNDDQAAVFARR
jgi:hypothetical protein